MYHTFTKNDLKNHHIKKFHRDNPIGVYLIYHPQSNRGYVGSTEDILQRRSHHASDLKMQCHKNKPLQKAYELAGRPDFDDCFVFRCMFTATREEAFLVEQYILDTCFDLGTLFNINRDAKAVGASGRPMSDAHREILRQVNTGKKQLPEVVEKMRQRMLGTTQSDATREKRRQSMYGKNLGKQHTEESRNKMRISHTGKIMSEEHRANIAAAHTGRINSPEAIENMRQAALAARGRKVKVDGVIYPSIRDAAQAFGIQDASARDRINSKTGRFDNWTWVA